MTCLYHNIWQISFVKCIGKYLTTNFYHIYLLFFSSGLIAGFIGNIEQFFWCFFIALFFYYFFNKYMRIWKYHIFVWVFFDSVQTKHKCTIFFLCKKFNCRLNLHHFKIFLKDFSMEIYFFSFKNTGIYIFSRPFPNTFHNNFIVFEFQKLFPFYLLLKNTQKYFQSMFLLCFLLTNIFHHFEKNNFVYQQTIIIFQF